MEVEQRADIKFCLKLGKTAREAYEMMKSVYSIDCLSHSNIFRWYAVFRDGREDTEDAPRASKPRESRTEENVKKSDRNSCIRHVCVCKTHRGVFGNTKKYCASNFDQAFGQTEGLHAFCTARTVRR